MASEREQREALIRALGTQGIHDAAVLDAMRVLPRSIFVPEDERARSYDDVALPIGEGQTISQPWIVARMLELLDLHGDARVLEVGAGSGYQAVLLGMLAKSVIAIERVPDLAERARRTIAGIADASGPIGEAARRVRIVTGDGSVGYASEAPFDRIVFAAATPALPAALVDQLAPRGKLVAPVGSRNLQRLRVITRGEGGETTRDDYEACIFVPLIGQAGFEA